ncbi:epigen [Pleuronectes platessa]|uniref:epigen n=1 Tax=Pleuronectes platessa TaxID=8262 RepID=UPI00232A0997|nr:epigen [Pleuronectes platessa]
MGCLVRGTVYKLGTKQLWITLLCHQTSHQQKMFTQRPTNLERVILSAVAVLLLLTTTGQTAILTDNLQTTAASLLSNTTTQLNTSSVEHPKVLRTFKSCDSKDEKYCENGGECMYPQDSDEPFCICSSSYSGPRCHFFSDTTHTLPEFEQMIGIIFGVAVLFLILAIVIYCFINRRCMKSAPLIKSAPSETSV